MRYTEARLDGLADEMMADLDKETVDLSQLRRDHRGADRPALRRSRTCWSTAPAGIAVGMATNVPPHNLREVIDAVIWLIETRKPTSSRRFAEKQRKLLELVPVPTFRRAASSSAARGPAGLPDRPRHRHHAREGGDRGLEERRSLVDRHLREIPYQVNKAKLIERIAGLVRDKTLEGISDIRDESDRDGLRIVIDLKRGEVGEVILNNLYKHTQLQTTFGIIMLAIVGGRPQVL